MARSKRDISRSVCIVFNYSVSRRGRKKIVDEVAAIRPVPDENATKELFSVSTGQMVYHTSNEESVIHIRENPFIRARQANADHHV